MSRGRVAALSRVVGNNVYAKPLSLRRGIKLVAQNRREGERVGERGHARRGGAGDASSAATLAGLLAN